MTMSNNQFDPASFVGSKNEYGNWMNYAGIAPTDTLQPVIPRTGNTADSWSEALSKAAEPITNKMSNLGNAGSQMMSGNLSGALNSMSQAQKGTPPTVTPATTPYSVTGSGLTPSPSVMDFGTNPALNGVVKSMME